MSRPAALSDNVAAALCYLAMPLSAIALLLLAPYSARPYVRFHALQAVFTFGAMVVVSFSLRIVLQVLFILPIIGRLVAIVMLLGLWVGFIVLWIWLMSQALQGKRYKLPYLGDFAERQAAH